MAKKVEDATTIDSETTDVGQLEVGSIIVLDDGETRAVVRDIGPLQHKVEKVIEFRAITYELLDGPWAGANSSVPLLLNDKIELVPEILEKPGFFARIFKR